MDFDATELAAIRAAFLGEPQPIDPGALAELRRSAMGEPEDDSDRIVNALARAYASQAAGAGHQATAGEKAAAYRQYAEARERRYGRPPDRERIRGSLTPEGASPMVRRLFGG